MATQSTLCHLSRARATFDRMGLRPLRPPRSAQTLDLPPLGKASRSYRPPALYVLVVFLAQYTSWGGAGSLYEPARVLASRPIPQHVSKMELRRGHSPGLISPAQLPVRSGRSGGGNI